MALGLAFSFSITAPAPDSVSNYICCGVQRHGHDYIDCKNNRMPAVALILAKGCCCINFHIIINDIEEDRQSQKDCKRNNSYPLFAESSDKQDRPNQYHHGSPLACRVVGDYIGGRAVSPAHGDWRHLNQRRSPRHTSPWGRGFLWSGALREPSGSPFAFERYANRGASGHQHWRAVVGPCSKDRL